MPGRIGTRPSRPPRTSCSRASPSRSSTPGIVDKIVPPLAAAAKVSVPLFKAQMKAQAEISINQAMGVTPASARIITALRTFIDTPKNLVVVVKAPSGLPLGTVGSTSDPKTLLSAVDIQVMANR